MYPVDSLPDGRETRTYKRKKERDEYQRYSSNFLNPSPEYEFTITTT